ncbi:hypothetical protein ABZX92_32445 [Lentzea sp. NPDC006480]|uniref:hypothetical protein n=1 Tax=Lentzea sp. NPDC006480 TaxID=3157176 RepID=UPI0033A51DDF
MATKGEEGRVSRVHTDSDLVKYSHRKFGGQRMAQQTFKAVQDRAAAHARLPKDAGWTQQKGDGELVRWPRDTEAFHVLAHYVPALYDELMSTNQSLVPEEQLRVRMSVVFGPSEIGTLGLIGDAPNMAGRLVDSKEVREAIEAAPGSPLAVIIDDSVYRNVVKSGLVSNLDASEYQRVEVDIPEKGFREVAWIVVPGRTTGSSTSKKSVVPGLPREKRTWSWTSWSTVVKGAVITAVATVLAGVITGTAMIIAAIAKPPITPGPGPGPSTSSSAPATVSVAPTTPTATTSSVPGTTWEEIAANRNGTPTFADAMGKSSTAGKIPFGTKVRVSCVAPNLSGMKSVNAFYRVETAPWQGTYAPANTFANGDELGSSGQTDVDPAVPACG